MSKYENYSEPSNDELNKQPFDLMDWVRHHIPLVSTLVGILVVGLIALGVAGWVNGIQNDGITRQNEVVAVYNEMKIELSTCLDNSMQAAGIAQQERSTLQDVLVGTASARYQNGTGPANSQIAITAIQEAYPNVSDALFKQLMTIVVGCRNQVAGAQDKLQYVGNGFSTWTQTGGVFEKMVRAQFPDSRLKVIGIDGRAITGRDALDFIIQPILTGDADQAGKTHTMPAQTLFPSAPATK